MKRIILASSSPRRKQLLKQIGLDFEVAASDIDEVLNPKLKSKEQAGFLSKKKALAVASKYKNSIIIAADSLVFCMGEAFGKPKSDKEAFDMLKKLSGKKQSIITGFTIMDSDTKRITTKSTETKIWFREMNDGEIKKYIRKEKPLDRAGAYAIQEFGAIFISKIEGDFFGGVGLSLFSLAKELKKFGVEVL